MLVPGGRLCLAIVHPVNSAGSFVDDAAATSPFVIEGSYLDAHPYADEVARDGYAMRFESFHRPLQTYTDALAAAGLLIERLREPSLPDHGSVSDRSDRWRRIPLFLHLRAVKLAYASNEPRKPVAGA